MFLVVRAEAVDEDWDGIRLCGARDAEPPGVARLASALLVSKF